MTRQSGLCQQSRIKNPFKTEADDDDGDVTTTIVDLASRQRHEPHQMPLHMSLEKTN